MTAEVGDARKAYTVGIAGVDHTLLLTDDDLPRYPDAVLVTEPDPAPAASKRTTR